MINDFLKAHSLFSTELCLWVLHWVSTVKLMLTYKYWGRGKKKPYKIKEVLNLRNPAVVYCRVRLGGSQPTYICVWNVVFASLSCSRQSSLLAACCPTLALLGNWHHLILQQKKSNLINYSRSAYQSQDFRSTPGETHFCDLVKLWLPVWCT